MMYDNKDETPDRRKGGMSEAMKGKGKLHMLHEGEIVLNRPTTQMLLRLIGIGKSTAMGMSGPELMKRVKDTLMGREESKTKQAMKDAPKRQTGGMARPARAAPKRQTGGMARPARVAPKRQKGGMSAPGSSGARAEREMRLGRDAHRDTL